MTTTDGGRGWVGRIGVGCDYQFAGSRWVVGAFGDYDFMGLRGNNSMSEVFTFGGGAGVTPLTASMKQTGAWYAGARVGYLVNPSFLTYVSGGFTGTRFKEGPEFSTLTAATDGFSYPGAFNVNGWFLGGGVDYAMDILPIKGLYWRNEYRFSTYQGFTGNEFNVATGALTANSQNIKSYTQTVTTSLVWKFNWAQPVVARY